MISNPPSDAQKRAQAKFDKYEVKKREGDAALAAYHAENRAIEAKTARLKAAETRQGGGGPRGGCECSAAARQGCPREEEESRGRLIVGLPIAP